MVIQFVCFDEVDGFTSFDSQNFCFQGRKYGMVEGYSMNCTKKLIFFTVDLKLGVSIR